MPHRDLQSIIVDNMSNGVCLVRAADNVIVYANPRFNRIYGYDDGELEGQPTSVLRSAEREAGVEVQRLLTALRERGDAEYVIQNRAKDGREILCRARTTSFDHPQYGPVWVAVHEDITEMAAKDAALRASEQRLRVLFEEMPVGVFETDARGSCVYVNPSWTAMTGLTLAATRDYGWVDVIHADDREALAAHWSDALTTGAAFAHEVRLAVPGRDVLHVVAQSRPLRDPAGHVTGFLGTVTDVSARVAADVARQETEAGFRRLVEGAPIGILVHELGAIRFANAALASLLGLPGPDALVGRSVFDALIAEVDHPRVRARMTTVMQNGLVPAAEVHVRAVSGPRVVEARSVPLRFEGAPAIAVIIRDMEAQRATLAAKEALLKEIHHRVKNNLQVVSSMLRLHAEKAGDDAARSLFTESVERVRAIGLLHEKLYQSQNIGAVDMSDYLEGLVAALYRAHAGPQAPRLTVLAEGMHLGVDLALPCGLIFNELVTNALKHAFVPSSPTPAILVELTTQDELLTLVVADNGVGPPASFDWGTASSLGVHLVRTFARQLRASVSVSNDAGTRWVLRFPRTAEID